MSNLSQRVLSAIILVVIVLTITWFGGFLFSLLAAMIGAAVFYEWLSITGGIKRKLEMSIGVLGFSVFAALYLSGASGHVLVGVLIALFLALFSLALVQKQRPWTSFGLLYALLSMVSLAELRGSTFDGLVFVIYLFAIVWATDIAAYFVGRKFGGPKLAPKISPGKTWSGAIGGTVMAVIAGTMVLSISPIGMTLALVALCLILSVVSQIGDLFESWIKRRFNAKDSSNLIPGHGGVMDRVDGLVAAAMMLYLLVVSGLVRFEQLS